MCRHLLRSRPAPRRRNALCVACAAASASQLNSPCAARVQGEGGGEAGLSVSILETPTYVLAVVFFIFIALSFIFELVRTAQLPPCPALLRACEVMLRSMLADPHSPRRRCCCRRGCTGSPTASRSAGVMGWVRCCCCCLVASESRMAPSTQSATAQIPAAYPCRPLRFCS